MKVSHLPILNPVPSLCPALVRGVPKVLHYGHCGALPCLVMEELGPNLEDLMQENICKGAKLKIFHPLLQFCGGRFSLQTSLILALQTLDRLQQLHGQGLVFRD